MWRTEDGVAHTCSVPDPSFLFTREALAAVEGVVAGIDDAARETFLEDLQNNAIAASWHAPFDPSVEQRFVAEAPPPRLFGAVVADPHALRAAVEALDWRWRLDLTSAIEDISDR
jgi:hypothetical protein